MIITYTIISLIIIIIALYYYISRAKKHGWTSDHNEQTDGHPTAIIGGGFIFYLSIILWSIGVDWLYEPSESMSHMIVGLTMLAACSFADDILKLKIWIRLVVQFIATLFLCAQLSSLTTPLPITGWIIFMICSVGFTNAYNFMDGINGMTGLYSITLLSIFLWYNLNVFHFISGTFILFALISALVFTILNCRKRAIIFCGDVGSISMGYIIVTILSYLIISTSDVTAIAFVLVYGVDTTLTIIRRIIERENIFQSHNKHLYQILNRTFGLNQVAISIGYSITQLIISIGYLCIDSLYHWHYIIASGLILTSIYLIVMFKSLHYQRVHQ